MHKINVSYGVTMTLISSYFKFQVSCVLFEMQRNISLSGNIFQANYQLNLLQIAKYKCSGTGLKCQNIDFLKGTNPLRSLKSLFRILNLNRLCRSGLLLINKV